jgi:hypothetical protein
MKAILEETRHHRKKLRYSNISPTEFVGALIATGDLRRREALYGNKGPSEGDLKLEFLMIAIRARRESCQQLECVRQMRHGFDHGRARQRLSSSPVPMLYCLLGETSVRIMMRD